MNVPWHTAGGCVSPQRSIPVRATMLPPLAGQGSPGAHGSAPGSGSPSCEMKVETIWQEIK